MMPKTVQGIISDAKRLHGAGLPAEAEKLYQQVVDANPRHADSLHMLGVIAHQRGHHERAIDLIGQAIQLRNKVPSYYYSLGNALRSQGKLDDAAAQYKRAISLKPDFAEAHVNLATVLQAQHKLDDAVTRYKRAIALKPNFAEAHYNLGNTFRIQGKLGEAAVRYKRAIALKPSFAEAHCNLGITLEAQGKLEEAITRYERAIVLKPNFAEAFLKLGNALHTQHNYDAAIARYEQLIALRPDYAEAHNNLGYTLQAKRKLDDAVTQYRRAIAIKSDFADAHNNLGNALQEQGEFAEAIAEYERALAIKSNFAGAHNNWGNALQAQGNFTDALLHYERAVGLDPEYVEAHANRASIKTFRAGDPDLEVLENLAAGDDRLSASDATHIHFALAKALSDIGDDERAFEHLLKGNALKRRQIDYDISAVQEYFRRICKVFDTGLFARFQGSGDPSPAPIFVLGMPRSGSTLIEQILSSHPQVHGAGELTNLAIVASNAFRSSNPSIGYPESVPTLEADTLRELGQAYLASLPAIPNGKVRITDKMPSNFVHIGLIRLILPNARIIHTKRDPVDTCVSCFSKLFTTGQYFSYDLIEVGRYYQFYSELMTHWRSVLPPDAILDVAYEDVIDDIERQARRLIDHCGLTWDDRCLDFHKNTRAVATASAAQVRQPLFRHSLQRWRRYEAQISPLLHELRATAPNCAPIQGRGVEGTHRSHEIAFSDAKRLHSEGRLAEAEKLYQQVLSANPRHADSLHMLGVVNHQLGRHEHAIKLINQAIQLRNKVPSYYYSLGNALRAQGKLDDAAAQYKRAISLKPDFAEAHNNLGNALALQNRLDDAVVHYERAIALKSDFANAHNNLGNALRVQRKFDDAVVHYERAIALKPKFAEAHFNLATVFQAQHKLNDAVVQYECAIALKPNFAGAYNDLGTALQAQGKLDDAVARYERAIAIKPDLAEAHNNLGLAFQDFRRLDKAVERHLHAIALKPDLAAAHYNLGNALYGQDKFDEAIARYSCAIALNPDYAVAHCNLGNAFRAAGLLEEAILSYERAIAVKSDFAEAHNNLGNALKAQGKLGEAATHYDRALAIKPDSASAHWNRTDIKTFRAGDPDLEVLENLAAGVDRLSASDATHIHFAFAKALSDIGDDERAFEHLLKGNALKRRQIDYDISAVQEYFRRICKVFDTGLFARFQGSGDPSPAPIFVLGMPRSGSTLIEQILSSHPQVHGAGELTNLAIVASNAFRSSNPSIGYPESVPTLEADTLRELGQAYLASLPAIPNGKVRITDKMPSNFVHIGLIRLILPNARIIHTKRDPVDTCVSCFSKLFTTGQYFSYDLIEVGRYYQFYSELMTHWRSVLPPDAILDVAYEDVIDDIERQARRLIDHCGLTWDDRCLDFHKNTRVVGTSSVVQVRQPLFRHSVQRWRRYEAQISPLLHELGVSPR